MDWSPLEQAGLPSELLDADLIEDSRIVVVDDEPTILRTVVEFLRREGYSVDPFSDPQEALRLLAEGGVALLVSDISMPGISGTELARLALEADPDIAVVLFTGVPEAETAVESLRLGVADYVTKPLELPDLEQKVARALRRRAQNIYRRRLEAWLRREVAKRTEALQQLTVGTLVSLIRAMEAKDPYLGDKSARVSRLATDIARRTGLPPDEVESVRVAGLLHDIGLIGVPESILHTPGELDEEQRDAVRKHVEVGVSILEPLGYLDATIDYVRYHHERLSGSGYPEGLSGEAIPLGAQIVGLADAYVALRSERPFRPAATRQEALDILRATEATWFPKTLLDHLDEATSADQP